MKGIASEQSGAATENFVNHADSSVAGLHYGIALLMRIDIEPVKVPVRQQRFLFCSHLLRLCAATWKVAVGRGVVCT